MKGREINRARCKIKEKRRVWELRKSVRGEKQSEWERVRKRAGRRWIYIYTYIWSFSGRVNYVKKDRVPQPPCMHIVELPARISLVFPPFLLSIYFSASRTSLASSGQIFSGESWNGVGWQLRGGRIEKCIAFFTRVLSNYREEKVKRDFLENTNDGLWILGNLSVVSNVRQLRESSHVIIGSQGKTHT